MPPPSVNESALFIDEDAVWQQKKRKEELQLLTLQAHTEVAGERAEIEWEVRELAVARATGAHKKAMMCKSVYYELKIKQPVAAATQLKEQCNDELAVNSLSLFSLIITVFP